MSLFRDYLRLLIVVDFVMMKSTGGFPPHRVFRHAGRDVRVGLDASIFLEAEPSDSGGFHPHI